MCKRLIALSLLLLLAFSSTSFAATYQITEAQLTALEQNLNKLESINKTLTLNSDESRADLLKALAELKSLKEQLKLSLNETTEARQDLSKANDYLQKASLSLKQLESKNKRLQTETVLWKIIAGIVGVYAVVK